MNKEFSLTTSCGDKLSIAGYGLNNIDSSPCLIFVHGFKGFKDWGFFPFLGNYFSKKGFFVLTFNFSHNGIGSNQLEFSEMDKFAKNTISLEISELSDLINAYFNGFFGKTVSEKVILVGHSRGGAVSLFSSLINKKPIAYVVWSSVANLDRYTERQKKEWRKNGFIEILNSRTKQLMKLGVNLLDDIESNTSSSLNIEKAVRTLNKPLLIIHGEEDLTVLPTEAEMIYDWSNKEITELVKIKNTGHTFGIVHPFENPTLAFNKVIQETENFLLKLNN